MNHHIDQIHDLADFGSQMAGMLSLSYLGPWEALKDPLEPPKPRNHLPWLLYELAQTLCLQKSHCNLYIPLDTSFDFLACLVLEIDISRHHMSGHFHITLLGLAVLGQYDIEIYRTQYRTHACLKYYIYNGYD